MVGYDASQTWLDMAVLRPWLVIEQAEATSASQMQGMIQERGWRQDQPSRPVRSSSITGAGPISSSGAAGR